VQPGARRPGSDGIVPYGFSEGKANAGYNHFPLNAWVNSKMNGKGFLPMRWNGASGASSPGCTAHWLGMPNKC
jgi:hypothetical protein